MAIRDGMTDLVTELRRRADAGTAEFQVGTANFYSDDHLQALLDRQRTDRRREALRLEPEYNGGTVEYRNYYWSGEWVERAETGSEAWVIETSAGSAVGTADYTRNYDARQIRFNANTTGLTYFLSYRAYDLDRAAAEIWEDKASHVADRYDIKTDNHDLKRSQLREQFLSMATFYRRRAPARSRNRIREDVTL